MADKVLAIVETAYWATLEERDDPIIWLSHPLRDLPALFSNLQHVWHF